MFELNKYRENIWGKGHYALFLFSQPDKCVNESRQYYLQQKLAIKFSMKLTQKALDKLMTYQTLRVHLILKSDSLVNVWT